VAPPETARRAQENSTVDPETGCWNSNYSPGPKGYATIGWREDGIGYSIPVHRASWNHSHGRIPDGMVIDHRCGNRRCVNPEHLRPLTLARNTQLRLGREFPEGQCAYGHPEDVYMKRYFWGGRYQRACSECLRIRNARTAEKRRLAKQTSPNTGGSNE
jgi:hypothetical protein